MSGANPSLSLKRRFRAEDDDEDDEMWRVGYAEDIDEKRAELLRRLDFKTSGPAKLVNPWATPGAAAAAAAAAAGIPGAAAPEGPLMLEVDLQLDGDGYEPSQEAGGGAGPSAAAAGANSDSAAAADTSGSLVAMDRLFQRSAAAAPEVGASGGRQLAAVGAAGVKFSVDGHTSALDAEACRATPARLGPPLPVPPFGLPSGHRSGLATPAAAVAAPSPYAALLGTPGLTGGGRLGPSTGPRPPLSPLPPRAAPPNSANHRTGSGSGFGFGRGGAGGRGTMTRSAAGGRLGGLLSLPSSSQKFKKAKFVIRDAQRASPASCGGDGGSGGGGLEQRVDSAAATAAEVRGPWEEAGERHQGPSPTAVRSRAAGAAGGGSGASGGSGLAALLGSGPPPPHPSSAAKHMAGSTPLIGRLQRISAPSPRTAAAAPGKPGLSIATAAATPARPGLLLGSAAATAAMEPTTRGTQAVGPTSHLGGTAADSAVRPSTQQQLDQRQGQRDATTPHVTPGGASPTAPASLRELLLPPPRLACVTTPGGLNGGAGAGAGAGAGVGMGAGARPDPGGGDHLGERNPNTGTTGPFPPSSQAQPQLPHPHLHLNQQGGGCSDLLSQREPREEDHPQQQQQEEVGGQLQRGSTLEMMGRQSLRQREFLQGLGVPARGPLVPGLSRRSGAGGRGGAALAGIQGRLQAVLANLKLALDREAELVASGRAPPPPPASSLLVEVRSRTREAHLTKASCKLQHVYGAAEPSGGGAGVSQAGPAPPAPPQTLPEVGQSLLVLLDAKRGDWGMEPGERLLVLPPYKVLHVGGASKRDAGEDCSDAGEAGAAAGASGTGGDGGAAQESGCAPQRAAGGGGIGGLAESGTVPEGDPAGQVVVVVAHVTRRWAGRGVT